MSRKLISPNPMDALPPYDTLLDVPSADELHITEEKADHALEELMRPKKRPSTAKRSDTTTVSLPGDSEDIAERATGIERSADVLIHRGAHTRRHQEISPILAPTLRESKLKYRTLTTVAESWIINRVMIYGIFITLIIGCTVIAGLATWKAKVESSSDPPTSSYDDNFFGNISQGLGGILGTFCMLIPLIERNRVLQPDIPVWCPRTFRWLLGISVVTSILSMATQRFEQADSVVFGYVSMLTQLVATMLLVTGSTEKITQRQRALDQLSLKQLVTSLQQV
ncbi:hypothetical protein BDW02DRAFT_599527 [Decorospora gaudefroyi]|uniref:Uncharacterized protein n=1 Tax=Decorospora gaudefroyi TaxID=184978 RepID=A0A6A5K5J6_9PLEO|nr:hypothetical protein BDW02DRAFT_599527 [Decorospora gaudefroyi]